MQNKAPVIIFSIFLIPISGIVPLHGTNFWYPQWVALLGISLIGIAISLWKFNKPLSVFLAYCTLNTIFVAGLQLRSLITLYQVALSIVAIWYISTITSEQRKLIVKWIIGLCFLQAFMVVVQYNGLDPFFDKMLNTGEVLKNQDATVGLSGSYNQLGIFFANTFPLIIANIPLFIPLSIFCLMCSETSSAVIGACVGSSFVWYLKFKDFWIWALVLGVIATVYFVKVEDKVSSLEVWRRVTLVKMSCLQVMQGKAVMEVNLEGMTHGTATKIVRCNPLLGFGLGSFIRISPHTQKAFMDDEIKNYENSHRYAHCHNDWVEEFFELGYIGLIIMIWWVIDLFVQFFKAVKGKDLITYMACVISHFVTACGIFTIHTAVSGMMLIVMLGLLYGEINGKKGNKLRVT